VIARDDVLESLQEEVAVFVTVGDGEAGVPSRGAMGEGSWECHALWSGHSGSITSPIFYFKI